METALAISPLDGKYYSKLKNLGEYFSDFALTRFRLKIEIEYLFALGDEKCFSYLPSFAVSVKKKLRQKVDNFSLQEWEKIKEIEETTKHDVKAVEYYLREALVEIGLKKYQEFVHFALTSEDVNNLSYALMWQQGIRKVYLPELIRFIKSLKFLAKATSKVAMLSLTHGQSATPTTLGKEMAVYVERLNRETVLLGEHKLLGKFGGATGTWAAHQLSSPQVDWLKFSRKFVQSFDSLVFNPLTTQIEPHDSLSESLQIVVRINNILIDLSRDMWGYISRGIFLQKRKAHEVGSSAMPHKINPIWFENAEGNLGLGTAILDHLVMKLPISRFQRDLSDSTVLRNLGVGLGHGLLAVKNLEEGFSRLDVNKEEIEKELAQHPEVLAEAIQVYLRVKGFKAPYEEIKKLTRGNKVSYDDWKKFFNSLDLPTKDKMVLLKLKLDKYIGLADNLTRLI